MGRVRDEITGTAPERKAKTPGAQNILNTVTELMDEISELTQTKDTEALTEGKDNESENVRKAGSLRAVHALLSSCRTLLESY